MLPATADVVVVGAGIAGASAGWALAAERRVVVLETEPAPGMHSTGRSAALLTETIGPPEIRALVAESRGFLLDPPDGFADHPLTRPRGVLWTAEAGDAEALRAGVVPGVLDVIDVDEARRLLPRLRPERVAAAAYEEGGLDLDVDAILQGFLRGLRRRGGTVVTGAPVTALAPAGDGWRVTTPAGTVDAGVVVNAAGAWCDVVARLAGVEPIGLEPRKRTAFTFAAPDGDDTDRWPMLVDQAERFYVKPDAGRLLGSPADQTPTEPCDAKPEEVDVALAVERIETALDLEVRGVRSPWAGLRSFAPDGVPVAGPDPDVPTFVWLAGQGGYGIKTSPGLAAVTAAHILGSPWPPVLTERGVTAEHLSASRLRTAP